MATTISITAAQSCQCSTSPSHKAPLNTPSTGMNITLSVDDEVLAAVRRHAAERNSTVNALVREYLSNLAQHQDRARRARTRLRQLSDRSQGRLGRKTWTREDLHDR